MNSTSGNSGPASSAHPGHPPAGNPDASASNPLGLLPGTLVGGRYRSGRLLGRGAMGIVFEATHQELDERVALKFLLPDHLENTEIVARFAREAKAAVKLKSEHVARVLDVGKHEGRIPYIVMEYLDGDDLGRILEATGPLPIDAACGYTIEACAGLAEAHAKGIVHRDVKPENLFLARLGDGRQKIKILDFGVSKVALTGTALETANLAATSTMLGSPLYMSPEQIRSREVDHRTDIWSLGIALHELLTGRTPFHSGTIAELVARVLEEAPQPLRELRADVPEALERVVLRCLHPDPVQRWESVAALAAALAPFANHAENTRRSVDQAYGFLARAADSASFSRLPAASSPAFLASTLGGPESGPHSSRGGPSLVGSAAALAVTSAEPASPTKPWFLAVPVAALLLLVGGGFFWMGRGSRPATVSASGDVTAAASALAPAPLPPPTADPAVPPEPPIAAKFGPAEAEPAASVAPPSTGTKPGSTRRTHAAPPQAKPPAPTKTAVAPAVPTDGIRLTR
jgi:eukaryotic-like serine/threonine-protein kinase